MLKWLPSGRLAWCLAAALLVLGGLAWHFAAASRLNPEALKTRPGPLVLDRTGRILRLVPEAQGGKLLTLPDRALPNRWPRPSWPRKTRGSGAIPASTPWPSSGPP